MLKARIQEDMKAAMKAGDKRRLGVVRLMLAAIKQREVDERIELDDTQVLVVLDKMIKQRRDSEAQYLKASRSDLADQEAFEILILQEYMPESLSDQDIEKIVAEAINNTGAQSIRDMGKVMGQIKPKVQGRADMGAVGAMVKQKLSG
jgi:uncharacterized protein YqeY